MTLRRRVFGITHLSRTEASRGRRGAANRTIVSLTLLVILAAICLYVVWSGSSSRELARRILDDNVQAVDRILTQDKHLAERATPTGLMPMMLVRSPEMIEILQKHGASVRAANGFDCTPLHFAAGAGLNELVKALVAKGALLEARDYVGDTPLFWAVNDGPPSEAGFDDTSYSFSVEQKGLVAKTLLMSGANINARNEFGQSPIFVAIRSHPKLVQLLLEHGADIGARTADNETVLHAAAYESVDVVVVLLRAGCEVNVKGEGGDTPLHIAARRGDEAMLQLLLDHGAQLDVRNDSNQLPLDCCATDACRRTLSEHILAK